MDDSFAFWEPFRMTDGVRRASLRLLAVILCSAGMVFDLAVADGSEAEEEAKEGTTTETFSDSEFNCTFAIPPGFRRLSKEEHRKALQGIVEEFGKDAGVKLLRRPPVWFLGSAPVGNPAQPAEFRFNRASQKGQPIFEEKDLPEYRKRLEELYAKKNERTGDIVVGLERINETKALRIDHDVIDKVTQNRYLRTVFLIPGADCLYEAAFQFAPSMEKEKEEAAAFFCGSFRADKIFVPPPGASDKWARILKWTIGGFFIGVLIHFLLRALAGVGEEATAKTGNPAGKKG
jgi:hypothetical protein